MSAEETHIAPAADVEVKAKSMGWLPEGEFRGRKESWVPAEEYVKRGETFVPFLQAERKKLERELSTRDQKLTYLETQLKEASETIEALKEFRTELNKERVEERREQLVEGIKVARENGDVAAEEALRDKLHEAKQALVTPPKVEPKAAPAAAAPNVLETPEWKEFVSSNAWWNDDPVMRAGSIAIGTQLAADGTLDNMSQTERYATIAKATKARFNYEQQQPASRVGTGRGGTLQSAGEGGQSWTDLPQDVRDAAAKFESRLVGTKKGQFKDLTSFRKNYASEYFRKEVR